MCKVKEFFETLSETTSVTKRELLFAGLACVFGGMVLGMFCSPKKRTMVGCNNGNSSGNSHNREENPWNDEWEEEFGDDIPDEILSFN